MKRWIFVLTLALVVPLFGPPMSARTESSVSETEWSVKASYLDACCCAPSCPLESSPVLEIFWRRGSTEKSGGMVGLRRVQYE